MAENYKALKAAFERVGHQIEEDVLLKVARVLHNPQGCENCGSPTKVGVIDDKNKVMTLACCNFKSKVG